MKFLIVLACALAFASAGHLVSPTYSSQHLPVIGPNGVPIDTPAVQQATATHLAHKVEAHARNGDYHGDHQGDYHGDHHGDYHGDYHHGEVPEYVSTDHHVSPVHAVHHPVHSQAYPTSVGTPVVTDTGVPLETPEVVAAKSAHFAAHGEALARTAHPVGHHYFTKRGVYSPYYASYQAPAHFYGAYGHHYLAKRGVYTPSFYSYGSPAYSYGAYGHHYVAKRGIYTPAYYSGYSHGYTHAYPYAY